MKDTIKKRPTSITVIGWLSIVIAGLTIISTIIGLAFFILIQQMGAGIPPVPEEIPVPFKLSCIIYRNFIPLVVAQIAFATFVLIAGIQFLKLRAWARTALEVVCWLNLVYGVVFGIYWLVSWINIMSKIPPTEAPLGLPPMFNAFGVAIGIVAIAVWVIPLVVVIKILRSKTIKEAVTQPRDRGYLP